MGGVRLIDKVCTRCKDLYKGIYNQQLCNICKSNGYDRICKHCSIEFISLNRYAVHCTECKSNKIWKCGKFPERGISISNAKKAFFQTDKGKNIATAVGKINSEKMKLYVKTDIGIESLKSRALKNSTTMKNKIAAGTFTPTITNTFTHWNAEIEYDKGIKKFRSSWEACIWYSNQHWEYETIRIPYIGIDNNMHSYIVDFHDPVNNILYEIKPNSNVKHSELKFNAAIQYCTHHNLTFVIITENELHNYINKKIFKGNNKNQLKKCLK